MISIGFLSDYPDTIPILAEWFREQWPDYYRKKSPVQMEQDFLVEASRDHLPSRLVAFVSAELAGTIVLREHDFETLTVPGPELGGLYVEASHRNHGIGTQLVRSGMKLALELGYETIYATTLVAAGILERLGWEFVKTVIHQDGELALYRCKLKR